MSSRLLGLGVLFVLGQASQAWGAFSESDRGTSAAQFLKLGPGARGLAMGEAQVAVVDDVSAIFWNPAGLTRLPRKAQALAAHHNLVESIQYEAAAIGGRFPSGAFAIGTRFLSGGDISRTDAAGNVIGDFNPRDWSLSASYAAKLPGGGAFGGTVRTIKSEILKTASSRSADVGLLSGPLAEGRGRLGVSLQNLGPELKFRDHGAPLPTVIRLGGGLQWTPSWLFAADFQLFRDNPLAVALGMEYDLSAAWVSFKLRAGFNSRTAGAGGAAGASTGFGIGVGNWRLDYAFLSLGDLGGTHRAALVFSFGKL